MLNSRLLLRWTETSDWSELLKDGGSDAEMAIGHEIQQMNDALAYVQMLQTMGVNDPVSGDTVKINASTILTGHSLGGALAQYVSFKTGYEAYTYNGFGIQKGEGIIGAGGGSSTPHTTSTPPAPKVDCPNLPNYSSAGTGGGSSTSPIVLDLNRNGLTSLSLAASIALFDYDGDGIKENTAWIESGDALLVNDVNGDGIINNARELFGNYTRNSEEVNGEAREATLGYGSVAKSGYQALSYYDTNGDSVIDASDTRYNELSVWIDANGDGVTDTGELKTLTEAGITSLKLGDPATPYIPTTENTNTIIQETTFTRHSVLDTESGILNQVQDDEIGIMRDVLFRYENNSTNKDGVYFDMDGKKVNCEAREATLGCGIKEKMLTWTDSNQWMVVNHLIVESKNSRKAA